MRRKIWKWTKRILLGLLVVVTVLVIAFWDLVSYGARQGYGQMNIIWNAKPVEEFLVDPEFPDFPQKPSSPDR